MHKNSSYDKMFIFLKYLKLGMLKIYFVFKQLYFHIIVRVILIKIHFIKAQEKKYIKP